VESQLTGKTAPKINNWIHSSPITGVKTHLHSQKREDDGIGALQRVAVDPRCVDQVGHLHEVIYGQPGLVSGHFDPDGL